MITSRTKCANSYGGGINPDDLQHAIGKKDLLYGLMDDWGYSLPLLSKCSHDYLLSIISNQMFYFLKCEIRYSDILHKPTVADCNARLRAKLLELAGSTPATHPKFHKKYDMTQWGTPIRNLSTYLEENPPDKVWALQMISSFHYRFGFPSEVCMTGYKPPPKPRHAVTGTAKKLNIDFESDFIKSLGPLAALQKLGRTHMPGNVEDLAQNEILKIESQMHALDAKLKLKQTAATKLKIKRTTAGKQGKRKFADWRDDQRE
jgi:hypothetical protein